jgi:hypothetical protein
MTEVLSLKVKSYLCSVAVLLVAQSSSTFFLPTLLHHLLQPQLFFLLHAVVCLIAGIFVFYFIPETMKRNFGEIATTYFPHKPGTLFEECGEDFEKLELPPITPTTRHFKNVTSIYVKSPAVL